MRECYASVLGDCGGGISGEHYFSASVLRLLFPTGSYKLGGFPWLKPGQNQPSIASLTANILCKKHNSELSPLDDVALSVFRFFDEHLPLVGADKQDKQVAVALEGELFERWILKVLTGVVSRYSNEPILSR